MKIHLTCPICSPRGHQFVVELVHQSSAVHEIRCPNGHEFKANIMLHQFQKHFEIAIEALADNRYRDAVTSFVASYERFIELFIRIVLRTSDVSPQLEANCWKDVSNQSERQLGAFILLFALEFKSKPRMLTSDQVKFRNAVVHKGDFPERNETIAFGNAVRQFIEEAIALLFHSTRHASQLIGAVNEVGDFTEHGSKLIYLPWALIATNRHPSEGKTVEQMLASTLVGEERPSAHRTRHK